mmetsp:Transcript_7543/g.28490  ORF Transcript_7543/g.28490 Transcript_7543/m.28490 type:complete len:219 (-) Transcript_7543:2658-3314(-)|eukprot:scaffold237_cov233-Pinguiococcus_pyrenoidosus.AAC.7
MDVAGSGKLLKNVDYLRLRFRAAVPQRQLNQLQQPALLAHHRHQAGQRIAPPLGIRIAPQGLEGSGVVTGVDREPKERTAQGAILRQDQRVPGVFVHHRFEGLEGIPRSVQAKVDDDLLVGVLGFLGPPTSLQHVEAPQLVITVRQRDQQSTEGAIVQQAVQRLASLQQLLFVPFDSIRLQRSRAVEHGLEQSLQRLVVSLGTHCARKSRRALGHDPR